MCLCVAIVFYWLLLYGLCVGVFVLCGRVWYVQCVFAVCLMLRVLLCGVCCVFVFECDVLCGLNV